LVTVCPDGRVNPSDQPLMAAVPVFVTVRFSVSPAFQALTASVTVHAPDPPDPELEALGDADADGDADGDGELLAVGVGDGVPPPLPSRPKR